MNVAELSLVLFGVSVVAGVVGSLLGLGGGFVVVPVLTLAFHLDIRLAVGTSIVAVAATSSAGAARNVRASVTNLRVATFLAVATTLGAVTGALLSRVIDARLLFGLFGLILGASGLQMLRRAHKEAPLEPVGASTDEAPLLQGSEASEPATDELRSPSKVASAPRTTLADRLALHSAYFDHAEGLEVPYVVARGGLGFGLMYLAGVVSGLLGIGSGVLKVPAMDLAMHIPMKVSTATSNLLIGFTAAASAVVYFARGDIDPLIAGPVAIGVLAGATQGSKLLAGIRADRLRLLFVAVVVIVAAQMLWKALG